MTVGYEALAPSQNVLELVRLPVSDEPFPHVVREQFISHETYQRLRETFPECPSATGPTGYSLYWGDDRYRQLLDVEPAWRKLFNAFHSQQFIDWANEQFAPLWAKLNCTIDPSQAQYVPYREDRVDKERPTLRRVEHKPEELWIRLDIHQGQVGYSRALHVDHRRRLLSMLIYFCDQHENQMLGGELLLHNAAKAPVKRIAPQHNLMVAFPCAARSHHSVTPITALAAPRNYVQVHISSSVDIWTSESDAAGLNSRSRSYSFNHRGKSKGSNYDFSPAVPSACLELESSRTKLLAAVAGAKDITVIRNPGNLGDHLMHAGMRRLLSAVDYREISLWQLDGARGELAVITGSGAWCKAHQHLPPYLPQIEKQFERVIIFPTSFDTSVKAVRNALAKTRALVFAREFASYEQIRHLCQADVAHDTAFFFEFEPYKRLGRGTLLAFRTDGEALTEGVPHGNRDIAMTCEGLDEFLWTISRHELVKTDRAHVMIAASLLGKQVLFGASNYHKVPALAASSLQGYPVFLVPDLRAKLGAESCPSPDKNQGVDPGDQEVGFSGEFARVKRLADERGRMLDEILGSRSFRIVSAYWRLRRYLSGR